jgi:hypothetical protein
LPKAAESLGNVARHACDRHAARGRDLLGSLRVNAVLGGLDVVVGAFDTSVALEHESRRCWIRLEAFALKVCDRTHDPEVRHQNSVFDRDEIGVSPVVAPRKDLAPGDVPERARGHGGGIDHVSTRPSVADCCSERAASRRAPSRVPAKA